MERVVETALGTAGDFAGAAVWRQACRELASGLRVAVLAVDGEAAARLARRLRDALPRVAFPVLVIDPDDPDVEAAGIGMEDALLGAHAALWATPVTAALGARERHALDVLEPFAPEHRGVVLTDVHLLERIADDPDAEAQQVRARLSAITPPGWPLLDPEGLLAWVEAVASHRAAVTRDRRAAVARVLLDAARERTEASLVEADAAIERTESLLVEEDAALEAARNRGERIAAHLLGSMRSNTQRLLLDLREFLTGLEADLPGQVDGLDDLAVVRRVLPHWLGHVVEEWMERNLAAWRASVLADISEVQVPDADARHAELLPPSLHPAPLRAESGWGRRLAVTAALGGGAALAMFGLWVPAMLVSASGIAWTALVGVDRDASRDKLLESARGAVRRMASDAERLLQEQLSRLEDELADLGDRSAYTVEQGRAELRSRILEQRAYHRTRSEELRQIRDALSIRAETLVSEQP